jgi:hypothetical protein
VAFDIDTYAKVGGRLDISDLDLRAAFVDRPLEPDALRCLRYMHDIENHTICYLRDVLVTRAHTDPDITTFLTIWTYEEHWHGEALAQVLAAHGEQAGRSRIRQIRAEKGRLDRLRPMAFLLGSALVPDLTAVHMTWGAINEWTTQAGYARLAAKARHPVLTELLRRIMRQEGRHIDFYAGEARRRLVRSRVSQRITRMALRRFWGPVGTGVRPRSEVAFVVGYLFGDDDGVAATARIDRNIDRLPGLAGMGLAASARQKLAGSLDDGSPDDRSPDDRGTYSARANWYMAPASMTRPSTATTPSSRPVGTRHPFQDMPGLRRAAAADARVPTCSKTARRSGSTA